MLLRTVTVVALICVIQRIYAKKLEDIGVPNYSCSGDVMGPSKRVPTSAHSVRPADIKVVMALGDSLTAANGAGAPPADPLAIALQYRGLAFQAGGDQSLETHVTIPNVLKKFNANLTGYSKGIGSENVWEVSGLNAAIPGAKCWSLADQAKTLVQRLKAHPDVIDYDNDWKLLNIFIGGNDMCNCCFDRRLAGPSCVENYIKEAIRIIYDNVPRVIVSMTTFLNLQIIKTTDKDEYFCDAMHTHECKCEFDANYTTPEMAADCTAYQNAENDLMMSGYFDRKDDFTLVVQPFMNEAFDIPTRDKDGYMKFFAPDCFHFSKYGHALVSTWLWRNIVEPVGTKTTKGSFVTPSLPLACPDPKCPFIRTTKNSVDCSSFYTDPL